MQLSEETIRRALTKITQKELALIEGRVTKKLTTQELTHQVEKRAVPKTTSSVTKAPNLPSWKKVKIDVDHVASGHMKGGSRTPGSNKTLFPENMTKEQIEKAIRMAYKYGKKTQTQGCQVAIEGYYEGMKIEIWLNTKTKEIRSAWPTS